MSASDPNLYHTERRDCPVTRQTYEVRFYYDTELRAPETEADGHGVVLDDEDYKSLQDSLLYAEEENTDDAVELRLRVDMMRRLDDFATRSRPKYYDVWLTLEKARKERWNGADPSHHAALMEAVNADFDYLRGWYCSDWWWVFVEVVPLDEEGEPMEQYRSCLGDLCSDDTTRIEKAIVDLWHDCIRWMEVDRGIINEQLSLSFT